MGRVGPDSVPHLLQEARQGGAGGLEVQVLEVEDLESRAPEWGILQFLGAANEAPARRPQVVPPVRVVEHIQFQLPDPQQLRLLDLVQPKTVVDIAGVQCAAPIPVPPCGPGGKDNHHGHEGDSPRSLHRKSHRTSSARKNPDPSLLRPHSRFIGYWKVRVSSSKLRTFYRAAVL